VNTVSLGDVITITQGFAFDSALFGSEGELPVVRIRDVVPGQSKTYLKGGCDPRYLIQDHDILIGMDGEFNRARWKGGVAALNQRVCLVRPVASVMDDGFLYHLLPKELARIEAETPFVTVKHLSAKQLRTTRINLPPLPEQRRIAAILDEADALRAKRRAALAQLDEMAQAIFVEMFGDPIENPSRWPILRLSEMLDGIDSGWSPTCLDRPARDGEWGVLKLGAVTKCEFRPDQNKALPAELQANPKFEVNAGDLLFTRKNTYELVAAAAFVRSTPPRLMLPDLIFRLRTKLDGRILPAFLHALLIFPTQRRAVQSLAGGSSGSMPNISKGRLLQLGLIAPPSELQQKFADRLNFLDRLKDRCLVGQFSTDLLFTSLQHRAFSGEL
jgi:type I restriction enzyme S subunit